MKCILIYEGSQTDLYLFISCITISAVGMFGVFFKQILYNILTVKLVQKVHFLTLKGSDIDNMKDLKLMVIRCMMLENRSGPK